MIKVIIIAIFFVLGVLAIEMGNKDAVGTVISYSLPLLALVMYCLCNLFRVLQGFVYKLRYTYIEKGQHGRGTCR